MMNNVAYQKHIPVRFTSDIFIAGGGPAGMAAAVTAAEDGRSVFLVESQSCLGGMGTAGLLPLFMQFGDGENFLAGGFGKKIYDAVVFGGGTLYNDRYLSIPTETLKRIYDRVWAASGVRGLLQTTIVDVLTRDNAVEYVLCVSKNGLFAVRATVFVDCTGDGDVATRAGAEYEKGDGRGCTMPATLCSSWAGVDWSRTAPPDQSKMVGLLEQAFRDGVFSVEDRHHTGMAQTGRALANANVGHIFDRDGTDDEALTTAFMEARRQLPEYEVFYNRYMKGYENAELVGSAALMGVRESRRITGRYVLTEDDYRQRRRFSDQIGCYCYEIDIHPSSSRKADYETFMRTYHASRYRPGEHYGIPYRCLTAKGFDNLLVAGRCISTDRIMQSSIRTMPGCFITGQAAGMAAAIAAEAECGVADVDVTLLQNKLKENGCFIGV